MNRSAMPCPSSPSGNHEAYRAELRPVGDDQYALTVVCDVCGANRLDDFELIVRPRDPDDSPHVVAEITINNKTRRDVWLSLNGAPAWRLSPYEEGDANASVIVDPTQ